VSFESQLAMYSQIAQPVYPIKVSPTIDFTMKKSQKNRGWPGQIGYPRAKDEGIRGN
jgi:hypothetical protein